MRTNPITCPAHTQLRTPRKRLAPLVLRSVGSAPSPKLRPSGVGTARRVCATSKSVARVSCTQNIMGASHVASATFGLRPGHDLVASPLRFGSVRLGSAATLAARLTGELAVAPARFEQQRGLAEASAPAGSARWLPACGPASPMQAPS